MAFEDIRHNEVINRATQIAGGKFFQTEGTKEKRPQVQSGIGNWPLRFEVDDLRERGDHKENRAL